MLRLISSVAGALGVSTWTVWLVAGSVIAGGLAYARYEIRVSAFAACDARWQAAIAAERRRIASDSDEALEASRRRIAELDQLNAKLEEELRNGEDEAGRDPHASDRALGTDSVRRLNRIH
jgi:hypothetical protein